MQRRISKTVWDQLKIARAAGASYGELAARIGISKGTILAHAHRHGWTRDIALARPKADAQSPAIDITDAVTEILAERGQQTRMKMSEFLLKAARKLAERDDIVVDSLEGAKILESLRASLFPQPAAQFNAAIGLEEKTTLILHYGHERPRDDDDRGKPDENTLYLKTAKQLAELQSDDNPGGA